MRRKPNILLFLTDDQRFDAIATLGNKAISTPNIDRLAARGTVFTRAYIPGGTSGAVCMPSRAMLHTGRTLFHLDREGLEIPAEHVTLGEHLQRAGYEAFGTGKWHNGPAAYARSFCGGAEIFFGGMADHWNVPACDYDPSGRYDKLSPVTPDPFNSNRVQVRLCDHISPGRHSTDLITEAAMEYLRRREDDKPFFLSVALLAPHDPRTMPERFRAMYDPDKMELPPNFAPEHELDTGHLRGRDEILAAFPRDPQEIKRHIAEYYAMISHLDDAFGRLTGVLEETGHLEDTIVVFAGDNGLAVGQHGLMGKQDLYDHSVRVPLILAGPGVPAGQRRDALVYLLDIFPTLCDMADIPLPASVEGRSLLPCLHDGGLAVRESLYLAFCSFMRGLTDGRHKLIEYACGATQLFDLQADPWETNNLAGQPGSADLLDAMRRELRRQAVEWDDEGHRMGREFWGRRGELL